MNASIVELNRLKTGRRASSITPADVLAAVAAVLLFAMIVGGGVVAIGLAGGLFAAKLNACTVADCCCCPWNVCCVGLDCSGKKLTMEFVGESERLPVGDARSEPVLILSGGDNGNCIPCIVAAAAAAFWAAKRA